MPAHPTGLYMEASIVLFRLFTGQFEVAHRSERLVARTAYPDTKTFRLAFSEGVRDRNSMAGLLLGRQSCGLTSDPGSTVKWWRTMTTVEHFVSKPFALPEYERAQFEFLNLAVKGLMKTKNPIYAQIREAEPMENLPTTQNTMPSGEVVATAPLMMATQVVIKLDDIRLRNLDYLAEQVDSIAEEHITQFMKHFYDMHARTCEGAGTATNVAGSPFTFESYLLGFSKADLRFQKDGTPILPQLVTSPEMVKAISALPPWTDAQQKQWDDMIEGKRKEFFANRRHRKLC